MPFDAHAVTLPRDRTSSVGDRVARVALPLAWLVLQAPFLRWLWVHLPSSEYATSLLLLALAGVPLAVRGFRSLEAEGLTASRPAVALLAIAAALSLAVEALWDFDLLSGVLFGVGSYALFGLYVSSARWRAALPAALLLVAALPFGHHLHAYLGFPARVAVASVVHQCLEALGIAALGSQTVLQLETGAMNVDLPCSGIRSAWTGLLFFLGASTVLRTRLGVRWALSGVGYLALLFLANVLRVAALALLSQAGLQEIARLVHEPLGVAGFVLASAAVFWGLSRIGARTEVAAPRFVAPRWWAPVLAGSLLLLAALRPASAGPVVATPASLPEVPLPAALSPVPLPLSEAERDLFSRHGARAQKARLGGSLPGTVVLVRSSSWRSHHPPEQCLRGSGRTVESDLSWTLGNGLPVRLIRLQGGGGAVWWFQSPSGPQNDLLRRFWAEWTGRECRWTLVSLVLDELPADPRALEPLTSTLSDAVAASFARTP